MLSPLAKKLLIKAAHQVLIINSPAEYSALLEPLPPDAVLFFEPENGTYDQVHLFVKDRAELVKELKWVHTHLSIGSTFWIMYPKKSSGIKSDLDMMQSWDEPAKYGLDGVASAAVNSTWTAIRFRPKDQVKKSAVRNASISQNEFGEYIDIANRQVSLPPSLKLELEQHPQALAFFNTLSYTNKKEYVLWLLTAKQEKTKFERLAKIVDKLLTGKKNPAGK